MATRIHDIEHEHVYGRVPKLAGSWIACVECGDPWRGTHKRSDLINENITLERRVRELEDGLAQEALFARALRIAKVAHADQKYGPQDYIEHPIRVAEAFDDPTLKIVALLHDVVEDSNVTVEDIRKRFGSAIADAIEAITRRDATYHDYILFKVARNSLARKVKIADLLDNLEHIDKHPDWGFASLRPRYKRALRTLGYYD